MTPKQFLCFAFILVISFSGIGMAFGARSLQAMTNSDSQTILSKNPSTLKRVDVKTLEESKPFDLSKFPPFLGGPSLKWPDLPAMPDFPFTPPSIESETLATANKDAKLSSTP
ncbi:hypothetical protein vseg_001719 [Gypsophila vaccaria]